MNSRPPSGCCANRRTPGDCCRSSRSRWTCATCTRPTHWAIRGVAPGYDTPDEDVYIEGRNIVLLAKAAVFMARARNRRDPDRAARRKSVSGCDAGLLRRHGASAVARPRPPDRDRGAAPSLHKSDVIRLGRSLGVPLELTLSCMQPVGRVHCGACSKCRERIDAFREAGGDDPTEYAVSPTGR